MMSSDASPLTLAKTRQTSLLNSMKLNILPSAIINEDAALFDHMRSIFVPQLIRPTNDSKYVNDFTANSLQLAFHLPFFMDALLACSGAEIKTNSSLQRRAAESHYIKALAGLRSHLANYNQQQAEVVILRTIMLLCIYEVGKQ